MLHSDWIAVLSDTHGVLPGFVTAALSQHAPVHIIHAGDVCSGKILHALKKFAPLTYVRGNMDSSKFGADSELAEINSQLFYVLHNIYDLDLDPASAGISAVIHGHLHRPSIEWKNDILFLNPGSCAYPRGGHPPSFARIELRDGRLVPEIIYQ